MKKRGLIAASVVIPAILAASSLFANGAVRSFLFEHDSDEASEVSQMDCPSELSGFSNTTSWYEKTEGAQARFEAASGCGSKYSQSYDLKDITLTIQNANGILARLHANNGTFFTIKNQLLLSRPRALTGSPCLGDSEVLLLDLGTSELRAPGLRTFLNRAGSLSCRRGSG